MAGIGEAAVRLAADGLEMTAREAAETAGKALAEGLAETGGKFGAQGARDALAEGIGDLGKLEAKAAGSSAAKMSAFQASMKAAGDVGEEAGSAAARNTSKALEEAEEIAAKKGASTLGKIGQSARGALGRNAGKLGIVGIGGAAAGIVGLVSTVMAGNEIADAIDKGEEVAAETRDGIVDVLDPLLNTPLSALGWSEKKIKAFEKGAANVVMVGGLVFAAYMIHSAFN